MMRTTIFLWAMLIFSMGQTQAGTIVYMRSTQGSPWGQSTNETAMDAVFGPSNWQDLRYETASPASTFSAATSFAFLEGGDNNTSELEAFLTANISAIENWVLAGGSLFLNAAPNEGNGMSLGFGGTNLQYGAGTSDGSVVTAAVTHPIFVGPFATQTAFTGNSFSHATISGIGLTALITGNNSGGTVLAEKSFGLGNVIFGGMTTTNFQSPNPAALHLRQNILAYGANRANQAGLIPEPSSACIWGMGIVALTVGARRRRKS